MTTERHAYLSSRTGEDVVVLTPSVCGCGQDLDVCFGAHCSRCGAVLATLTVCSV